MRIRIEKILHISISPEENCVLETAHDILQGIYEEIDEEDSDIGCKAYDAAELINEILDQALAEDK